MPDLMPDYDLERAKLELDISQHKLNIQASQYRKLQLASEMKRIDENIEAANAAIAALEGQQNDIISE